VFAVCHEVMAVDSAVLIFVTLLGFRLERSSLGLGLGLELRGLYYIDNLYSHNNV